MSEWTGEKSDSRTRALMIYREEQAWITAYLAEQITGQLGAAARSYRAQKSGGASDRTAGQGRFYEGRVPGVSAVLAERVAGMGTCMLPQPSAGSRQGCSICVPGERALRKLAQALNGCLKERHIAVFSVSSERALYAWADLEQLEPTELL